MSNKQLTKSNKQKAISKNQLAKAISKKQLPLRAAFPYLSIHQKLDYIKSESYFTSRFEAAAYQTDGVYLYTSPC